MADDAVPWSTAWRAAATGPRGFYRRDEGQPDRHFATSVMVGDSRARQLMELVLPVVRSLSPPVTVTDVGAADGTLLSQLIELWPPDLLALTRWVGVDVRDRPAHTDPRIEWIVADAGSAEFALEASHGVAVAHELLDDLPCDIVEPDDSGQPRLVLVDQQSGLESLGPPLEDSAGCAVLGVDGPQLAAWCERWWPRTEPFARIEVGTVRDAAWRAITASITEGIAVAVDYSHVLTDRTLGRWDGGTLSAYAHGRPTRAVPDGSCNLTAHVALDACGFASGQPFTLTDDAADFRWLVHRIVGAR